jgi:hypothetical protein
MLQINPRLECAPQSKDVSGWMRGWKGRRCGKQSAINIAMWLARAEAAP